MTKHLWSSLDLRNIAPRIGLKIIIFVDCVPGIIWIACTEIQGELIMNGLGISCEQVLVSNMTQLLVRGHLGNLITLTTAIEGVIEFMLENFSGPSVTRCTTCKVTNMVTDSVFEPTCANCTVGFYASPWHKTQGCQKRHRHCDNPDNPKMVNNDYFLTSRWQSFVLCVCVCSVKFIMSGPIQWIGMSIIEMEDDHPSILALKISSQTL